MGGYPFIHLFKTPFQTYFYDVNANEVAPVSAALYEHLQRREMDDLPRELQEEVSALRASGLLSGKHPRKIDHEYTPLLTSILKHDMQMLILQVTQQCNFRCDYCIYVPRDFDWGRQHSPKRMDIATARKAIDFYCMHSDNQQRATVSFYGGEPLLELELMRETVNYAQRRLEGKTLSFSVTTNGSLLTDEVQDFLAQNNFFLTISLDGPRDVHNRQRKFAANGEGTFDAILEHIGRLKSRYPEYYRQQVTYNMVMDSHYGCDDIHCLVNDHPLFRDSRVQATLIDDSLSLEKIDFSEDFLRQNGVHEFKVLMSRLGRYPVEKTSRLMNQNIQAAMRVFESYLVPAEELGDVMAPSGPCLPGARKLFVDTDGRFYPCEKVSETSAPMNIGDLERGFDEKKVSALLNIGALTPEECKNCWAIRACTVCLKGCDNNGELSGAYKLSGCREVRSRVEENLQRYMMERELKERLQARRGERTIG